MRNFHDSGKIRKCAYWLTGNGPAVLRDRKKKATSLPVALNL